jgi:enamine deaminase RidA (YjgF/YER057c/UK114 family)
MRRINPPSLLPPPGGRFAHAVVPPAGAALAFVAGQVALDGEGSLVGPGDIVAQAGQCFTNLKLVVEELGSSAHDIVQIMMYAVAYQPEMLARIDAAGDAAFGGDWPVAATTLVGVETLGHPDFLFEITATVVVRA